MTDPIKIDLLIDLNNIREEIISQIDLLQKCIEQFLNKNRDKLSTRNIEDINRISATSLLLTDKIADILSQENINRSINGEMDASEYLSKLRHNLHNLINIMHGYAELVLIDLQKIKGSELLIQFSEIQYNIQQITRLTDEVKLLKFIDAHLDHYTENVIAPRIELKEYQEYKDKITIMIVDDMIPNCDLLNRYLQQMGFYNISIAHNGKEALDQLEMKCVDLLLLDLDMPIMSGRELLEKIKPDIDQHRLMVLIITGYDEIEHTIDCLKLGASDLITKPFNTELLSLRVNACVEKKWLRYKDNMYRYQLEFEKRRSERLLHAIFPGMIVEELIQTGKVQARNYNDVAILFIDIVNFTPYCDTHEPKEVINYLQQLADISERIAIKYHVQKIKTIGDCFLGVAGMLANNKNPVLDCINCVVEMMQQCDQLNVHWKLHAGIHFGKLIGGIVGHRQYLFDIWGDSVNTCARIQDVAEPNAIYLSHAAFEQVKDHCIAQSLGKHEIKGKKPIEIFKYEKMSGSFEKNNFC